MSKNPMVIEFLSTVFRSARFRAYALRVQAKRIIEQDREASGRAK